MRIDAPDIKGPLAIETVNNAVGDFLTYSGSVVVRRTAAQVRSDIGATTVGSNLFQLANPSAVTFLRVNADNTVSTLSATDFRTAIGAGTSSTTGTVTSVSGTGTVSGLSLSGTVTTSGNITLSGTLSVAASNFSSQTANTFLAAPNGSAGVPTFRTIVAADIPTLNQNTTGTAAGLSSTLVVSSGGTGATTLTGVVIGNGTSAMTGVAGTASQVLRRNAGNTAYEFFTIAGSDITGAALTATNDTNVTITLGGTPATALLRAASLTLGWTGTLAIARGGTGLSALGTANQLLRVNAGATALEYFTPSFLTAAITSLNGLTAATQTFANDTNVTITSATSTHTIGWSGQLSVSRGGTGASTLTGVLIGNGTSAVTAVAGTASQILRRNAGNTAYEFFTIAGSDITGAALTKTDDTNVTLTLGGTPATALLRAASLTLGWTGQLAVGRGGTGASTLTGVVIGNGTSAMTAVAGTASQLLRRNAGNTAYEFFTQTLTSISDVTITTPTNGQVLQYNGTAWVNATPSGGGTITGSGTTNYITKWTGTTAIGNSLIFDNGTQVLVNTTTATGETFEVNGTARIAGAYLALNSTGNDGGKLRLFGSSSEYAIGTGTSVTFGAINSNTATNFTMPNNSAMGWRWADSGHTAAQGAMALSTDGKLTVAAALRVGAGESDTTLPGSYNLDVQGSTYLNGATIINQVLQVNENLNVGGQVYSPVNAKGNSGTGTVTFNWNDGNIQTVTLTGNCTFAFSNPQSGASYQIIITQDGTGGRTITWPTIHWEAKTTPTLTGTLNSKDIVTLTYDGTNYNGVIVKNFGTP